MSGVWTEIVSSPSASRSRSGDERCAITAIRLTTSSISLRVSGQVDSELAGLGDELRVVGELAVDLSRRQPDAVGAEGDVVVEHGELDLAAAARNPPQLVERTRRDDRLQLRHVAGDSRTPSRTTGRSPSRPSRAGRTPRRTKTPVSTGRDSSRPAARPTHAIASSSGSASSVDVGAPSTSGSRGKSSTAYVRSLYEADPLVTSSVFSSAWYSISTSSAGSWRTMSPSSRPGTTALPSPADIGIERPYESKAPYR